MALPVIGKQPAKRTHTRCSHTKGNESFKTVTQRETAFRWPASMLCSSLHAPLVRIRSRQTCSAQKTDASATNALCPTPCPSGARSGHRQPTSAARETEDGHRAGGGTRPRGGMWRRLIGSTVVAWVRCDADGSISEPLQACGHHFRTDMTWRCEKESLGQAQEHGQEQGQGQRRVCCSSHASWFSSGSFRCRPN